MNVRGWNLRVLGLVFVTYAGFASLIGCGGGGSSFAILGDTNSFSQAPTVVDGKVDILWVVDNSGSMQSSQQNIADNFASFINLFNTKGIDYRMAVVTTEAYRAATGGAQTFAKFRDGTATTGYTGVFVITPTTPNLNQVFLTNILQGISGSGDERAFQSFKEGLTNSINDPFGFPRAGSFLSIIIVSDEDDFSHNGSGSIAGQYNNANLHTVDSYVSFLDTFTSSTAANRSLNYNVNSITIMDQPCLDLLNQTFTGRRIGTRYLELSDKTKGIKGSLCDDFGVTLASISNRIVQLKTAFVLNREPVPETIRVYVNGVEIPQSVDNGWSYSAANNSITFHGSAIPSSGATINVTFDPKSVL